MLTFPSHTLYQSSKCFVTHGTMAHLDQEQPPSSKHKPWAILASQGFIHKVRTFPTHACSIALHT